jgi:polyhydroxybutyrate depolymerase
MLAASVGICATACAPSLPTSGVPAPGDYQQGIAHDGLAREYRVHLPPAYDGRRRLPLVVVLHGAFSSAASFEEKTGFSRLADAHGFISAYPEGTSMVMPATQHWNAGHCCGKAQIYHVDDKGFVERVIALLEERLAVDPSRIYLVGYSNGGMLAYRVAIDMADQLAGVAVVAGNMDARGMLKAPEFVHGPPPAPVSLLAIHGRGDERIAYGGKVRSSGDGLDAPIPETARYWAASVGCSADPVPTRQGGGRVVVEAYRQCTRGADVVLMTLLGWGHEWPDAAGTIWSFFAARPRPSKN